MRGRSSTKPSTPTPDDQNRGFKERDCGGPLLPENCSTQVLKEAGVEWIAKKMLRDVRKCGYHGKVVFRTDGEPAILDLMGEVARLWDQSRTLFGRTNWRWKRRSLRF